MSQLPLKKQILLKYKKERNTNNIILLPKINSFCKWVKHSPNHEYKQLSIKYNHYKKYQNLLKMYISCSIFKKLIHNIIKNNIFNNKYNTSEVLRKYFIYLSINEKKYDDVIITYYLYKL